MDAESVLAKVSDSLSVRRAFGAAYERDGMLIIPVALVLGGGGGGASPPRRHDPGALPASGAPPHDSGRADAGGGFGGLVLPSGASVVQGDQVRWVPAVDVTVVVLASLVLARVVAGAWSRRCQRADQP